MHVGFIGLGNVGEPMARNILNAEYTLTVYDIRETAMDSLEKSGAFRASSPAEVARSSDTIFLSLPDPDAVEEVVLGDDGIINDVNQDSVVIDTSTIGPETELNIATELKNKGARFLGAPISGGKSGSQAGTLTIMASGDQEAYLQCQELLKVLTERIFYISETPEHGQAMKLLNNYLTFAARAATHEATILGEQVGLEMDTMIEVFNESSGHNSATGRVFPKYIVPRTFDKGSTMSLINKDIQLAMEFAKNEKMPMMLGETVNQLLSYAESDQGPGADSTRLHTFFERMMTGKERVSRDR